MSQDIFTLFHLVNHSAILQYASYNFGRMSFDCHIAKRCCNLLERISELSLPYNSLRKDFRITP